MGLLIYPYFLLKATQSKDVCELLALGIFSPSLSNLTNNKFFLWVLFQQGKLEVLRPQTPQRIRGVAGHIILTPVNQLLVTDGAIDMARSIRMWTRNLLVTSMTCLPTWLPRKFSARNHWIFWQLPKWGVGGGGYTELLLLSIFDCTVNMN
jgi:hypothetical protein